MTGLSLSSSSNSSSASRDRSREEEDLDDRVVADRVLGMKPAAAGVCIGLRKSSAGGGDNGTASFSSGILDLWTAGGFESAFSSQSLRSDRELRLPMMEH